jgi:hypothetical protein
MHITIYFFMYRDRQGLHITYLRGDGKSSTVQKPYLGQVHELRHIAPVIWDISHEELVEGTKAAGYASR